MAQKITLGSRPKTFPKTVEFSMLDGETGCIPVTFHYRTRKENAKLVDELQDAAKALAANEAEAIKVKIEKGEQVELPKNVDLLDREMSVQVDYLMKAIAGWGLDEKFDRAALEQLADELPQAIPALIDGYRKAINEGRLGN